MLLGRRARPPYEGKWDTPGGFIEEGEDPLDALRRELREETGLEVEPGAFVTAYTDRYGSAEDDTATLNLLWEASVVGGEPHPDDDVAELRWFALDELPEDEEIAFGSLPLAARFVWTPAAPTRAASARNSSGAATGGYSGGAGFRERKP